MQLNPIKAFKTAGMLVIVLLFWRSATLVQQKINLTAGSSTLALPDGSSVPMWGYSCGLLVSGSTATCINTNPTAAGWSPVVITLPTGSDLQINLTNNLTFGS